MAAEVVAPEEFKDESQEGVYNKVGLHDAAFSFGFKARQDNTKYKKEEGFHHLHRYLGDGYTPYDKGRFHVRAVTASGQKAADASDGMAEGHGRGKDIGIRGKGQGRFFYIEKGGQQRTEESAVKNHAAQQPVDIKRFAPKNHTGSQCQRVQKPGADVHANGSGQDDKEGVFDIQTCFFGSVHSKKPAEQAAQQSEQQVRRDFIMRNLNFRIHRLFGEAFVYEGYQVLHGCFLVGAVGDDADGCPAYNAQ